MNVDFNELRKKIVRDYNALLGNLQTAVVPDPGFIVIPFHKLDDIKTHLDNLRNDIITLGCIYEEGNKDCICILDGSLAVKTFDQENKCPSPQ